MTIKAAAVSFSYISFCMLPKNDRI